MSVPKEPCNSQLSNGLSIITEEIPESKSTAIGVWVNFGSRDEEARYYGGSHFLEHLLFKGTKRRSALACPEIQQQLE